MVLRETVSRFYLNFNWRKLLKWITTSQAKITSSQQGTIKIIKNENTFFTNELSSKKIMIVNNKLLILDTNQYYVLTCTQRKDN
jgi:hypothetical protein